MVMNTAGQPVSSPPAHMGNLLVAAVCGLAAAVMLSQSLRAAENMWWIVLAYLAPVPIFAAGFSQGKIPALVAGAVGCALLLLMVGTQNMITFSAVFIIPAALLGALAVRHRRGDDGQIFWYPTGYLLTAAMVYAGVCFILINSAFMGQEGGLQGQLTQMGQQFLESRQSDTTSAMTNFEGQPISPEQQTEIWRTAAEFMAQYLPTIVMSSWLFFMVITGVATLRALGPHGWSLRPDLSMADLELPAWFLAATVVLGLVAYAAPAAYAFVALNLFILAGAGYMFVGLGLAHRWAKGRKWGWLFLVPMYVLTIFGWPTIFIALAGFLVSVWRVRHFLPLQNRRAS